MIKRIEKTIKRFHSMKLNKKIILLVFAISLIVNMLTIISISIFAVKEIKIKSSDLIKGQVEMINNLLANKLEEFSETALLISSNETVKNYLMYDCNTNDKYMKITSETYDLIRYSLDADSFIDYISLIKFNDSQLIYVGETWTNNEFRDRIIEDFNNANLMNRYNFKISFDEKIFNSDENVINIYTQIGSRYSEKLCLGFLVIGIDVNSLNNYYTDIEGENEYQQFIIDSNGTIISHKDKSMIGESSEIFYDLNYEEGEIETDKSILIYKKIKNWDWYMINEVPKQYLIKDTYTTLVIIILILIIVAFVGILTIYKLSNKLYEPIDVIVNAMEEVSRGNLDIRIKNEYEGTDFKQMTRNFNVMIEEINLLMKRIKDEENIIKQIELNRLQSQIKPHFLYNTLECIHWQALADGSKNASKMVKALASFYRVSLSSGKDIINISEEIKLIKNYLIIQNMRYSDIVKLNVDIQGEIKKILIPKMTLQPLVENSIYHGIKLKNGLRGEIYIYGRCSEEKVVISLSDTGIGMTQEEIDEINSSISILDESNGYGIKNVNKRIEMIFGSEYGLFYRKNKYGQTTVDITLPRRWDNNV